MERNASLTVGSLWKYLSSSTNKDTVRPVKHLLPTSNPDVRGLSSQEYLPLYSMRFRTEDLHCKDKLGVQLRTLRCPDAMIHQHCILVLISFRARFVICCIRSMRRTSWHTLS